MVILMHKQYWLLFMFLILSIFLNYPLGVDILGLPLTTQKVGMIITFILLFPLLLSTRYPISNLKTPFTLPFLFLIITASLSSLVAKYPEASYKSIITLLLIFIAIHIIYISINISDPKRIKQGLSFGITGIFIVLLGLAIYQFVREGNLIGRMTGTFRNPNEFGAMVLMILPVTLADIEGGNLKLAVLGEICLALSLVAIYFTYSRATYLATLFFTGVIIIGNSIVHRGKTSIRLNKKKWAGISLIIIIGFLIYYAVPKKIFGRGVERYQSIFTEGGLNLGVSSINMRYNAIWVALKLFRENPFLGIGMKNFKAYSTHLFGVGRLPATENTYLNVLTELGLFGFFIFMYIIFRVFSTLIENQKELKTHHLKCLNKYLTYGFIAFLFLMFTNDFVTDLRAFWIWVAVIVSLKSLDEKLINRQGIATVNQFSKVNNNFNEEI